MFFKRKSTAVLLPRRNSAMKLILPFLVVAFTVSVISAAPETYSNRYDKIDIDSILKNDRVLTSYIKCILEKGPCTPEGREFRDTIPEAIATTCAKCTGAQKKIVKKASKHIMEKRKDEWEQIKRKFDPKGEHEEGFHKFLEEP